MSFFYLSPVKGTIPFHVLEVIVTKRLEHLNTILRNTPIEYNEYVIDGSVYDNVGHFTLCIAAILERNNDINNFLLSTEVALFKRRLYSLSTSYDIRCFARKLLKNIRKLDDVFVSFIKPLQVVCQHIYLKHISQHLSCECNKDCTLYHLELKFLHCLEFISKRRVELNNGMAKIPCNKWKEYLIMLFRTNLNHKLYNIKLNNITCDPRINEIVAKVRNSCRGKISSPNSLSCHEVDGASKSFPPCMLNLHLQLRKRHRLSHEQRFNYSLFLKDIGMPVNESIEFWKMEYSKAAHAHSCCHNWEQDEKKFLYGIRHMYGLEGGKKSYSCRNCSQIQNIENSCSEGGCPFKSFGDAQMQQLLYLNENDSLLSQINELKVKHQYSKACVLYLENKLNDSIDCDKVTLNLTPVTYFLIACGK
ncbi:DNA primase large subunit-like [Zerene cesonia]|uniref:DNA primase large subunit-like n=1 Tax=Zerene cesonia TaxID=33412 RepID=UPI0018E520C6|nr:DNA primase large subunit-like [Zerene cesonia]